MSGPVNKITENDLCDNKPARVDRINLLNLQMQTIKEIVLNKDYANVLIVFTYSLQVLNT
jgi:hypothetical protein